MSVRCRLGFHSYERIATEEHCSKTYVCVRCGHLYALEFPVVYATASIDPGSSRQLPEVGDPPPMPPVKEPRKEPPQRIGIDRIEWANGQLAAGTRVILSNGMELDGVVSASQSGQAGCLQTFTITCNKPSAERRAEGTHPPVEMVDV